MSTIPFKRVGTALRNDLAPVFLQNQKKLSLHALGVSKLVLYAQSTGTVISGRFCTRRRSGEEIGKFQFRVDIVAQSNAVCEKGDFVFNPFEDGQQMKRPQGLE